MGLWIHFGLISTPAVAAFGDKNRNFIFAFISTLFSPQFEILSATLTSFGRNEEILIQTAFTRCRHILKTVKNSTDRPPVHTKTAHFLPADFENGRF